MAGRIVGEALASCPTNTSYIAAAEFQSATAVATMLLDIGIRAKIADFNRDASEKISGMQDALAQRQVELAEQVQEHAAKFWPEETAFVDDVFSEPKNEKQYEQRETEWFDFTHQAEALDTLKFQELVYLRKLTYGQCIANQLKASSGAVKADLLTRAARQEESVVQAKNDMRYDRQVSALSLGKGIFKDYVTADAIGAYSSLNAGKLFSGAMEGLFGTVSYLAHRRAQPAWEASARESSGGGFTAPPGLQSNRASVAPSSIQFDDPNQSIFSPEWGNT